MFDYASPPPCNRWVYTLVYMNNYFFCWSIPNVSQCCAPASGPPKCRSTGEYQFGRLPEKKEKKRKIHLYVHRAYFRGIHVINFFVACRGTTAAARSMASATAILTTCHGTACGSHGTPRKNPRQYVTASPARQGPTPQPRHSPAACCTAV